jgi:hypothetical protein
MNLSNNPTVLLRTIKNGIQYHVYEQQALPFDLSNSFITFAISTIERLYPQTLIYPHVLSRLPTHDGYECIQIIASKGNFKTTKFLYWAESMDYVTYTAIVPSGSYICFPRLLVPSHGTFLEDIQGKLLSIAVAGEFRFNSRLAPLIMIPRDRKAQWALPV